MSQFTSSKTTGGGVIVNSIVTPSSDTVTYTVTAPNGTVATATQNASGGLNPATLASLQQQLAQGGADAQTFSIGLTSALSTTTNNANEQAAAAPVGAQETKPIPASTAADPEVPQPVNQFEALRQSQIDRNGGVDPNATDPNVQAQFDRINANRAQPGSDGSLPTQADFAALRQAQIDQNGGVDPNAVDPALQAQLDRINERAPGPPLGTLSEQLAAAGLSAPPSQLDQGTIDALNRIEANRAQPGSDGSLPTQADFAALRAAQINQNGGVDPNATPPDVQAQLDRINAKRAGEVPPQAVNPVAYDDDGNLLPGFELNENGDPVQIRGPQTTTFSPKAVPPSQAGPVGTPYDDDGNLNPGWTLDENNNPVYVGKGFVEPATQASASASREQAAQAAAIKEKAKQQATFQARYKQPGNQDWRVRLSLSPNANYLYNQGMPPGTDAGILAPLAKTDGVIFPYTPSITTTYSANYEQYDLVHSNYRGVFYKNSRVGDIQLRGTFTAQDTAEANYLLAVIHFFRSATKMFYGQDPQRGSPPPVCLLNGFGTYQFSDHPVVISSFNYTTPNDVDYIRATNPNNYGSNMLNRRSAVASSPGGSALSGATRLINALLPKGAQPQTPNQGTVNGSVNNTVGATYVPTKMEIDITLIPVQTRTQVSKQFSLKGFANGQLLKGGFW